MIKLAELKYIEAEIFISIFVCRSAKWRTAVPSPMTRLIRRRAMILRARREI